MLMERGLLHGDCLTVTGKTLAENLAEVEPYPEDQDIIRAFDNPVKADSHLRILHGNLAHRELPVCRIAQMLNWVGQNFEHSPTSHCCYLCTLLALLMMKHLLRVVKLTIQGRAHARDTTLHRGRQCCEGKCCIRCRGENRR